MPLKIGQMHSENLEIYSNEDFFNYIYYNFYGSSNTKLHWKLEVSHKD